LKIKNILCLRIDLCHHHQVGLIRVWKKIYWSLPRLMDFDCVNNTSGQNRPVLFRVDLHSDYLFVTTTRCWNLWCFYNLCVSIVQLSDLPEIDCLLITQSLDDHCHLKTLNPFSQKFPNIRVIATPNAKSLLDPLFRNVSMYILSIFRPPFGCESCICVVCIWIGIMQWFGCVFWYI